jgi:hypothetical protein
MRTTLATVFLVWCTGCFSAAVQGAVASDCESELVDKYLGPYSGNSSRDDAYVYAQRLCLEKPDDLAKAKELYNSDIMGLQTDERFVKENFANTFSKAKYLTPAQVKCTIAEHQARQKVVGYRWEFSEACQKAQ